MAFVEFLAGRAPTYEADKDPLASPLPQEADDLRIHVEMCAKRYGNIMEGQALSNRNIYDLKAFIVRAGLLALLALAAIVKGDVLLKLLSVM